MGKVFSKEDRQKSRESYKARLKAKYESTSFDDLSIWQKKRRVLEEQAFKCASCGLSEWLDKPIPLELDHTNGVKKDNSRVNLRCLCPNCHALTDTWRKKKSALVAKWQTRES